MMYTYEKPLTDFVSFTLPREMMKQERIIHKQFINSMSYFVVLDIFREILEVVETQERKYNYAEISSAEQLRWFRKAVLGSDIAEASVYMHQYNMTLDGKLIDTSYIKKIIDLKFDEFVRIFHALTSKENTPFKGMTVSMVVPKHFNWGGL